MMTLGWFLSRPTSSVNILRCSFSRVESNPSSATAGHSSATGMSEITFSGLYTPMMTIPFLSAKSISSSA